ncbi:ribonucleotide-diphosphate reductase subunit beta [Methylocaldum szegediense]|uniref:ribonucleotide-diphosphate reductase subunit beta n=1 Tax=Methylocaldum szegediense TaxID=73780 RepID=UPI00042A4F8D|nr:ribonucleotide-diphosphate reductase subunit beta [Methylocaldum szegediense]
MNHTQKTTKILNKRLIIEGERSNLMAIRPVKYEFARNLLTLMKDNNWDEREINLTKDQHQYQTGQLAGGNLTAYKKALAFLSNLDGIQLNNLVFNIGRYVTAPEISMVLVRQSWEEALHVLSYSQMIESIGFDPIEIYWMFEEDGMLAKKNDYIMKSSMILGQKYTPENFMRAVAANVILEGVYFYNGFLTFYALEKQGLMKGSAEMIKLIQRDEVVHLHFFIELWKALLAENRKLDTPELQKDVLELFRLGVELEAAWGSYIISEGVLGLTPEICKGFVEYRADECLKKMGLPQLYGTRNPVPWFEDASKLNGSEENFFESAVGNYQVSAALEW